MGFWRVLEESCGGCGSPWREVWGCPLEKVPLRELEGRLKGCGGA
jgi:hypothetical protein